MIQTLLNALLSTSIAVVSTTGSATDAAIEPLRGPVASAPRLGAAAPAPQEAGPYSAFNPVPRDQMRDLVADRPDVTEAPITVDAGHVQFEVSLTDWTRDRSTDQVTALAANAKLGLTKNTDIQLVFDAYSWRDADAGEDGFSDIQIRYKWNLWGNDGGDDALAFFPYVKIPTDTRSSNGEFEGGVAFPYSTSRSECVGLGLMAQFDAVDDGTGDLDLEILHTAVLGFGVTDRLGLFTEYVGVERQAGYLAQSTIGGTYEVNRDFVLDAGVRLGISSEADDLGVFIGFTARY